MWPAVSLVAAIDNFGEVFLKMTRAHSTQMTFQLFLMQLVYKLDTQDPDWRVNTIVMLDGASYHMAKGTKDFARRLRIPMIFVSPHSPMVSPIELLFKTIKSGWSKPKKVDA